MPRQAKPSDQADVQRKGTCKNRYGENVAGKWVRSSAFRENDYDPSDPTRLREFDTFEEAFAFDEECRLNGTGGRKAVHLPKPKDTVPKEQLALEKAMKHALEEDGNKTRVQLEKLVVKTEVKEEMDQGKRPNYHSGGHKPRWLDEQTEIPEEEYRSYRTKRPGRSQND